MKRRHLLMLTGLVGSGALVAFGDKTPTSSIAEPIARTAPPARPTNTVTASATLTSTDKNDDRRLILALQPRSALLDRSNTATSNALFGTQTWTPPPPVNTTPS